VVETKLPFRLYKYQQSILFILCHGQRSGHDDPVEEKEKLDK
jgi:hypothetical protein